MITLVLGGARSGKSEVAERMAGERVTYVATWRFDPADTEMAARVACHRDRRPPSWVTVEADDDLPGEVRRADGTVLVDSLTTWLAGTRGFSVDVPGLCMALRSRSGHSILVSDEVGLGVHPSHEAGRRFRDALGALNQAVAAVSDDVVLVVAGRCLRLEALP